MSTQYYLGTVKYFTKYLQISYNVWEKSTPVQIATLHHGLEQYRTSALYTVVTVTFIGL